MPKLAPLGSLLPRGDCNLRAASCWQGGRWMDEGNMPRNRPTQIDQPEVKAALAAAQDPEAKVGRLWGRLPAASWKVPQQRLHD